MSKNFDSPLEVGFCRAIPEPTFADWWNRVGRLFMAGNDVHVQRAVMGVAERAWFAGRESR